jgi:hypothetical protein
VASLSQSGAGQALRHTEVAGNTSANYDPGICLRELSVQLRPARGRMVGYAVRARPADPRFRRNPPDARLRPLLDSLRRARAAAWWQWQPRRSIAVLLESTGWVALGLDGELYAATGADGRGYDESGSTGGRVRIFRGGRFASDGRSSRLHKPDEGSRIRPCLPAHLDKRS